jgi:hypothetical protein
MRPLALVDSVAAAVLHSQQFVLARVEFVVADGRDLEPHHREGFDRGLVVKQRREQRARADQIAGRDKDGVLRLCAKLLDQRRHVLGATGRHRDLFVFIVGIGDPDSARRWSKIAVEIVDRENSQVHRLSGGLREVAR